MKKAQIDTELLIPGNGRADDGFPILGYICRAVLTFLLSLGFAIFIADSLKSDTMPQGTLVLTGTVMITLIATVIFSLMGISKKFFISLSAVGIIAGTVYVITADHIVERLFYDFAALRNTFFMKLSAIGYSGMRSYILNYDASMRRLHINHYICLEQAFTIVVVLLTALFAACVLRRVHILPIVAVGSAVCAIFLYYGMNGPNTGFAMIMAAAVGVIALAGYDRIFADRASIASASGSGSHSKSARREITALRRRSSSMGGFIGLASALAAALLLVIPAGLTKRMDDIPAISIPAAKLENYFVSLANGKNPDFGSLLFSGVSAIDKRSTAFENRSYSGTHVFTVSADTNIPVYIRNWVGTYYQEDSWHSPSYDDIAAYKEAFGEGFSPELLTSELLWAVDENLVGLKTSGNVASHIDLGYITARVDIRKYRPTANLLFLPSYSDQRLGLLEYGTRNSSGNSYSNYSDGIFSSTSYVFLDEYSTIANLPLLRDPDFAQNLSAVVARFENEYFVLERIINAAGGSGASDEALAAAYPNWRLFLNLDDADDPEAAEKNSLPYRYIFEMDDHDRYRVLGVGSNFRNYRDYVYETYLTGCENFESFESLARSIIFSDMPTYQDMDYYRATNLKVRKIIDFLSKNMVYTLNPKSPDPDRPYINAAETFLFDTHEGYCVQFATSAVMLIRALGIPARYAEGYIADNFTRNRLTDATARYSTRVLDSNAHAWIEVYLNNYGWVLYEATTPYMSDMYDGYHSAESDTGNTTKAPEDPVETLPEETTSGTETPVVTPDPVEKKSFPAWILTAVIAAALIVAVIIVQKSRASRADRNFERLKSSAASSPDSAKALNAEIYRILRFYGLAPAPGEQRSGFSKRVGKVFDTIAPEKFEKVSTAMQTVEFAASYSPADAMLIASYAAYLRAYSLRECGFAKKIFRRYFLAI